MKKLLSLAIMGGLLAGSVMTAVGQDKGKAPTKGGKKKGKKGKKTS